ncbi:MAG TPA: FAD-dependent oxidoreductase [Planctomycetaceae bacterium]|nr:FAD-dependent oxidoreductase [Planctomycetaceae bacterium]
MPLSFAMESGLNQLALEQAAFQDRNVSGQRSVRDALEIPDCESTLPAKDAGETAWDVAVIGAGPAGALAARQLALRGLRTLLVDRNSFPREKVCGGCISGLGRRLLERVGLTELLEPPSAAPLARFDLAAGGRRVSFELPAGAAVSRLHFDVQLVRRAVSEGAAFLGGTPALVRGLAFGGRFRTLFLQHEDQPVRVRARIVIAADGLGRSSLKRHRAFASQVAAESRIGLGATLSAAASEVAPGCVLMSVAKDGYVGMVHVPGDALNIAAAVDPNLVRDQGPAEAVRAVLIQAGVEPPPGLASAEWRGTGLLTRQSPRHSARRLLVLGDAAGYVEPFTGEGMTWGMLSAMLSAPLLASWLDRDSAGHCDCMAARQQFVRLAQEWSAFHHRHIAPRQRDCRVLAGLLRHPAAVGVAMTLISFAPAVAKPLIRHFWNSGKDVDFAAQVGLPARHAMR